MMRRSKAYDLDLRNVAIDMRNQGLPSTQIAKTLKISQASVFRWSKRENLERSPMGGSQPRVLGIELKELLNKNPGKTLKEMAQLLPIQATALSLRLKKEGFTYKQKSYTYAEGNEEKQKAFAAEIASLPPENLYYLDESGFEERALKEKGWDPKGERLHSKKKEIELSGTLS